MFTLLVLVASIGLADSLNPTTIAPAIYLATTDRGHAGLLSYTIGVFLVYLGGGLLLTLGPGQLLLSAIPHPSHTVKHIIELIVGVVALVVAVAVWLGRERIQQRVPSSRHPGRRSAFALGAGITAVELPTAFPYFAAIAAIVGSGKAVPAQIALLVVFNALFVLPLAAITVFRHVSGDRAERVLGAFGEWLHRRSSVLLAVLAALVGVVCLTLAGAGFAHAR